MIELFRALTSPAKKLMAELKYSVKFILISLIFIIPLVLSLVLLQYEYGEDIRFTNKELEGLELINIVGNEQVNLSTAIISNRSFIASLTRHEDNFTALQSDVVTRNLAKYLTEIGDRELSQGFSSLNVLSQSVADYSNLELDLELATSYLVTVLVENVPQAQLQLARTARLARDILSSGSFSPETYVELSSANQKLLLAINEIQQSLIVSLNDDEEIRKALSEEWSDLRSTLLKF